jgi:hypothetical protein
MKVLYLTSAVNIKFYYVLTFDPENPELRPLTKENLNSEPTNGFLDLENPWGENFITIGSLGYE